MEVMVLSNNNNHSQGDAELVKGAWIGSWHLHRRRRRCKGWRGSTRWVSSEVATIFTIDIMATTTIYVDADVIDVQQLRER